MGNSISSNQLMPTRLLHCFDQDGDFDTELFLLYLRNKKKVKDPVEERITSALELAEEEMEEHPTTSPRKKRSVQRHDLYVRNEHGEKVPMHPRISPWYAMYVECPSTENLRFQKKFRRRFRLPFSEYEKLLVDVRAHSLFLRWQSLDATKKQASPIQLLLLGSLRYLGRGWTFDDLEEATAIHEETHRQFFHVFIEWGSTWLYEKYVSEPFNSDMARQLGQQMQNI